MPFSKIGGVTHPGGTHLSQISRAASHPYTAVALMAPNGKDSLASRQDQTGSRSPVVSLSRFLYIKKKNSNATK